MTKIKTLTQGEVKKMLNECLENFIILDKEAEKIIDKREFIAKLIGKIKEYYGKP